MKRLLLAILTMGFFSGNAVAQAFNVEHDTVALSVSSTAFVALHNELSSTQTQAYTWEVTNITFPHQWMNLDFGICDGMGCYGASGIDDGPITDTLRANIPQDLKLQLKPDGADGTYYVTVRLRDAINTFYKDVVYVVTKLPTGVGSVGRNDEVSFFPNPAKEALNVIFNERAGVKNIAVYNLIGKIVSIYKVSGNSAKLDLGDVPAGIYFVRLLNGQGQIVATRKFTHQ